MPSVFDKSKLLMLFLTEAKPPLFASERFPAKENEGSLIQRLEDLPPITVSFKVDQFDFKSF